MNTLHHKQILPHLLYFNNDHSRTDLCTPEISQLMGCTYSRVGTWQQLSNELEAGGKFLVFHANMITQSSTSIEFVDTVRTMVKFIPNLNDLKIGTIVNKDTNIKLVKDLQRTSVQGILLNHGDYSMQQASIACNAFTNGIPYWPKEILSKLPGGAKLVVKTDGITLTHRQQQVFDLIRERGASNKAIAKTLGISESTVKLHVTEIFKKYGVRSRTQLAVFATA